LTHTSISPVTLIFKIILIKVHNEKALLDAVSRGDQSAFSELFHAYHQPLAEFILSVTHSLPLTEDIVQDTFIKVWLKRDQLPNLDQFTDWLFILSRNFTLSALRKTANRHVRELDWNNRVGEHTLPAEPFELDHPGDTYRALLATAVDRLPPQQQKVWRLSREQNLTYNEIAAELKVAPSTIKSHMQAALASVRGFVRGHIDPAILAILLSPLILK
jgi:RNA polymerase sigma factor (sigma-70 family)